MKIMVISDIHGKAPALQHILTLYREQHFDQLFILGDILYHGPRNPLPEGYAPMEVVELLNPLQNEILAIRGNCDSEVDQMVLKFSILSDSAIFQRDDRRFVLTHGHLEPPRIAPPTQGELRLSGHSHIPVLKQEGGIYYFNPGSLSLPKEGFPPSYGIIDHNNLSIHNLETDTILFELTMNC